MILEEFDMKEFLSMTKRDERKEGYERGRSEGIISTCRNLGLTKEETTAQLIDKFHFSQEEAAALMEQYWKK